MGGACVPPLLGAAADLNNSTAIAMSVPLAFFVAAWSYALCVNFVPAYRDPADKFTTVNIGLTDAGGAGGVAVGDEESASGGDHDVVGEKGEIGTAERVEDAPEVLK